MNKLYQHSGLKGSSRPLGLISAILFSAIFSVFYAFLRTHTPFSSFPIILAIGNFIGVMVSVALSVHFSRCRNISEAKWLGKLIGIVMIILNWPCYVYMANGYESILDFFQDLSDPFLILRGMDAITEASFFTFKGNVISPIILWGLWIAELLLVYLLARWMPAIILQSSPYCEYCNKWLSYRQNVLLLSCNDENDARDAIQEDIELLLNMQDYEHDKTPHFKVSLYHCEGCGNTSALDIVYNYFEYATYSSRLTKSSRPISPLFTLTSTQANKFLERIQKSTSKRS